LVELVDKTADWNSRKRAGIEFTGVLKKGTRDKNETL